VPDVGQICVENREGRWKGKKAETKKKKKKEAQRAVYRYYQGKGKTGGVY